MVYIAVRLYLASLNWILFVYIFICVGHGSIRDSMAIAARKETQSGANALQLENDKMTNNSLSSNLMNAIIHVQCIPKVPVTWLKIKHQMSKRNYDDQGDTLHCSIYGNRWQGKNVFNSSDEFKLMCYVLCNRYLYVFVLQDVHWNNIRSYKEKRHTYFPYYIYIYIYICVCVCAISSTGILNNIKQMTLIEN